MKITKDFLLVISLLILAILSRTIFHIAPNVEFITAIGIVSGYFFANKKLALIVPIISLAITDTIIGNTNIFLFTWSGFFFAPIFGIILEKFTLKFNKAVLGSVGFGILSTLIFYFWTNFGVVVTSNMYHKNLDGVVQSYINAIPFLRNQIVGNMIIVPVLMIATFIAINLFHKRMFRVAKTF